MTTLQEMEREFRKNLSINIIPNMYDGREAISQEVLGELKATFPEYCTDAVINRSADINEATKRRTTVLDVNVRGTASRDVNRLTHELLFKQPAATQTDSL
jgi:cellulose biosynthesis protein BcsQ